MKIVFIDGNDVRCVVGMGPYCHTCEIDWFVRRLSAAGIVGGFVFGVISAVMNANAYVSDGGTVTDVFGQARPHGYCVIQLENPCHVVNDEY